MNREEEAADPEEPREPSLNEEKASQSWSGSHKDERGVAAGDEEDDLGAHTSRQPINWMARPDQRSGAFFFAKACSSAAFLCSFRIAESWLAFDAIHRSSSGSIMAPPVILKRPLK